VVEENSTKGVARLLFSGTQNARTGHFVGTFKYFCVKRYTTKEEKYGDNKRSVRRTAEGLQQSG